MIRGPMRGPVSGGVEVREVHGEETRWELLWLRGILESVYGPWGSQLILQPQEGGAITRTRQSREILSLLSPRSPLLKLMVSHLYQHCLCYQDSTLYAGILATNLILQGLQMTVARVPVSQNLCRIMEEVEAWLRGGASGVSLQLDLTSSSSLIHLVSSFMASKLSQLPLSSLHHLAALLLQGMLSAVSSMSSESSQCSVSACVSILPLPRGTIGESKIWEGLVLHQEDWHSLSMLSLDRVPRDKDELIRTALFTLSLAGDNEGGAWVEEGQLEGVVSVSVEVEVKKNLMRVADLLLQKGAGLLVCQKCVHPWLKNYLLSKGMLVVERVSSECMPRMHSLCGGTIISSTSLKAVQEAELGMIRSVRRKEFLNLKLVQMIGKVSSHTTLLLCGVDQNRTEIEVVCRNALKMCEWLLGDPAVICGSGCMDTAVAHFLSSKVELAEGLGREVLEMMSSCFQQQAQVLHRRAGSVLTDSTHHHCWSVPGVGASSDRGLWDEGESRGKSRHGWRQLMTDHCCCGGVALSSLPSSTNWHSISPHFAPPTLSQATSPCHHSNLAVTQCSVCDLMAPRLAALRCAAELACFVLTTAFTVSSSQ